MTPLHLLAEQTDSLSPRPKAKEVEEDESDGLEDEDASEEEKQARQKEKERRADERRREKEEEENTLWKEDLVELRKEIGKFLIEYGTLTPTHSFYQFTRPQTIFPLPGASPITPSKSSQTPLTLALTHHNHPLVTLFLLSGKIDFTTLKEDLILYLGNLAIKADAHVHDVVMAGRWPQIYDGGVEGRRLSEEKKGVFREVWGVVEGVCKEYLKNMVGVFFSFL